MFFWRMKKEEEKKKEKMGTLRIDRMTTLSQRYINKEWNDYIGVLEYTT